MANENIIKLSEGFGEGTVGDVLTLKDENTVGWQTPQGGSTYTPGSMIQIDNDTINIKNDACSAIGEYAIAVGYETSAIGDYSHAEGYCTSAVGQYSHANGYYTSAIGKYSFTNGTHCIASGLEANAEGCYTSALGDQGHTEGNRTVTLSDCSHAEGGHTSALNLYAHAEGFSAIASGQGSHTEGRETSANGNFSHAEGYNTIASGYGSHTEGRWTSANGNFSHAEGRDTIAAGYYSHAEGSATYTLGRASHVEGLYTSAIGDYSHAEGLGTIAETSGMHAGGSYNATSADALFVIGNGTYAARSDAFIVYPTGQVSGSDFTTNGVSLSGMLLLYNALTARPLTGSYSLKCIDGVLTWEGEVPTNAISVNGEQVGVNNEGIGINDTPPSPSYNYIILQNFLDGHTIGTPVSDSDHSDFYNTYPADLSTLWYTPEDWSDTNLVSTTAGDQLLYSDNSFDFSKYGLTAGQVPFGFCKGYDIYDGAGYANITLPSSWTLETWFYSPLGDGEYTDPFWGSFFEIGPSYPNLLRLYVETNSIALFAMDNDILSVSKTVTNQEWHHVALSCDGTNLYLFYDGELLGTVAIASDSGLSTMLASAVKVMVNVDSNGNGSNELWYAQLALCDECKWTDDFVPPKYAY